MSSTGGTRFTPSFHQRVGLKRLAELREKAGFTQRKADAALGIGLGAVARYEQGINDLPKNRLQAMLTLYHADEETSGFLHKVRSMYLEEQFWTKYSWVDAADEQYFITEDAAWSITCSNGTTIPGLLQAPEFSVSVSSKAAPERNPSRWEQFAEVRSVRQRILDRRPPRRPTLTAFIPEYLLTWGDPTALRFQLRHLLELGKKPNVTIRVVRKSSGFPMYAYDLYTLPYNIEVAVTTRQGATFMLETEAQIDVTKLHLHLCDEYALPEAESTELINKELKEIS